MKTTRFFARVLTTVLSLSLIASTFPAALFTPSIAHAETLPSVVSGVPATVTGTSVTIVDSSAAPSGAAHITSEGIAYGTTQGSTRDDYQNLVPATDQSQSPFSVDLTSLTCSTTYYFRAYATDDVGAVGIGDQGTFTTSACETPAPPSPAPSSADASSTPPTPPALPSNNASTTDDRGADRTPTDGSPRNPLTPPIDVTPPTVVITSPQHTSNVGWVPVVDWGDATVCEYEFNGDAYQTVDCANNGSDIPAPAAGPNTLYVRGTDASFNMSDPVSATFNYVQTAVTAITGSTSSIGKTTAVLIGGTVGADGGGGVAHIGMKIAADDFYQANEGSYSGYLGVANSGAPVWQYGFTAPGLTCGTTYHYQAYAYNDDGSLIGYGADRTFVTTACNIPELTNEYKFDEGSASTCSGSDICDSTGSGVNGTNSGGTWAPVPVNGGPTPNPYALEFDNGANENGRHVTMASKDFGSSFSISAWVKPEDLGNIRTILGNAGGGGTDGFKFYINSYSTTDHRLLFETGDGLGGPVVTASSIENAITPHQWQLVTVVVDKNAGTAELYVNGTDVTESNTILTDFSTSGAWSIGSMNGGDWLFTGQIDDLRIYDAQLDGAAVTALTNSWTIPDGTAGHPYHINSCLELTNVNAALDAHYVVDTNLNCGSAGNSVMIGSPSSPFTGDFDGGGHRITVNIDAEVNGLGLFSKLSGAHVHDVWIAGSVRGDAILGSLAAYVESAGLTPTIIERVKSTADVTSAINGGTIGGLVATISNSTIEDSYVTGNVEGGNATGGIAGSSLGGTFERDYRIGTVTSGGSNVGGVVGESITDTTVTDSFVDGPISTSGFYVGAFIGKSDNPTTFTNNLWDQTAVGILNCEGVAEGDPSTGSEAGCAAVNTDGGDASHFIANNSSTPFAADGAVWDFTNVWDTGTYFPKLRSILNDEGGGAPLGPTISITNPAGDRAVHVWAPSISWGGATQCQYQFDGTNAYITMDGCGNSIPAPSEGMHTLHIRATTINGASTASVSFVYVLPTEISSCTDFATQLNGNLAGAYILTKDLDCTTLGNDVMIGSPFAPFTGYFNGGGHKMTVSISTTSTDNGLFSVINGGEITNLWIDGSVTGGSSTGALAGYIYIMVRSSQTSKRRLMCMEKPVRISEASSEMKGTPPS